MRVVRRARWRARATRLHRHRERQTRRWLRHRRRPRTPTTGSSVASTSWLSAAAKSTRVAVHWRDRSGNEREVMLHSFIAGIDPGLRRIARARDRRGPEPRHAARFGAHPPAADRAKTRRRPQRLEAERARTDRAACSTMSAAPSSAACDGIAATTATRDLVAAALCAAAPPAAGCSSPAPIAFASATAPDPAAQAGSPLADRGRDHASRRRLPGAGRLLRRSEEDRALRRRRQPARRRRRRSTRARLPPGSPPGTRPAIASSPGTASSRRAPTARWSGRVAIVAATAGRSAPAANERRVCRYLPAGDRAIDANIASAGDDVDVGAALLGRNFLVVAAAIRVRAHRRPSSTSLERERASANR